MKDIKCGTVHFNMPVCLCVSMKREAAMCKQRIINYNRKCAYANGFDCFWCFADRASQYNVSN